MPTEKSIDHYEGSKKEFQMTRKDYLELRKNLDVSRDAIESHLDKIKQQKIVLLELEEQLGLLNFSEKRMHEDVMRALQFPFLDEEDTNETL